MQKQLIIAEKPSVARDIATVMIRGTKATKDGYIESEQYVISWAIGHLVTLGEPEDYDMKYKKWNMGHLPIIPEEFHLKPVDKTEKQFSILKQLLHRKDVEQIICATDAGREGELIFRYIYQLSGCTKPFKRLWISSMTEEAISKGFQSLKDGREYDDLYRSAKCRSEADWLIGINGTRAYTVKNNLLYSIGRVQTPTLAIIVDRYRQIKDFKPEDYWEVKSIYENFQGIWIDMQKNNSKIATQARAEEIAAQAKGCLGRVTKITEEDKTQAPPLLYDLTELQRDGNQSYGYTAKETLDLAQALYERHKLITYPRTDSRYLSEDMRENVRKTLSKLQIEPYREAIAPIIDKLKFTGRIINDKKVTDHHACIPTPVTPNLQKLNAKERNIYDLIVRRFIAVFYPYYQFQTTSVVVEVGEHAFLSKGKVITQWGWKELYRDQEMVDKAGRPKQGKQEKQTKQEQQEEQQLPRLKEGDQLLIHDCEINKKQTQPPKQYTESALLGAMENAGRFVKDEALKEQLKESGLGTPATRAAIIERLIQVGYIIREKKVLLPTEKGIAIIGTVPQELTSPETTGKWERALNKMARGEFPPPRFMESIKRFAEYIVVDAKKSSIINK